MFDLFQGELYRLAHKRNMYRYFGVVALGVIALHFMRSSGYGDESVVTDAATLFSFLPALLGGYFFTSLYTDDLAAKNLITLVGFGTSRSRIVVTKLLLMALTTLLAYGLFTALHLGIFAVLGHGATGSQASAVLVIALQSWLLTLGFAAVSSVVVYGLQKATFAVVTYFMLAFSVVTMLITAATSMVNIDLTGHLISGTTSRIMGGLLTASSLGAPLIEYLAYVALAIAASIFLFKNRELEF